MAVVPWRNCTGRGPSTPRQIIPQGALSEPRMARRPLPNNWAENVMQTPILSWASGDKVGQHDVYFGEDEQAVSSADTSSADIYRGRQDGNARVYHPDPLEWNKTYYWRVDEVNALEPLYVVLEDSSGQVVTIVNPNPDAVLNPLWTEWAIPLSSFSEEGIDLSSVKAMTLGLGDRDNPTAGGTGMLFVDDINIIKPATDADSP